MSAVQNLPVAVIGAGPIGLAAAVHLLDRGFTPLVLEAGTNVADNLASYRHVQLFSPWRYNIDKAAQKLLETNGWKSPPPETLPTAGALIESYLQPLAAHPAIAAHVRLSHRVVSVVRAGVDKVKTAKREAIPFALRVQTPDGEREFEAQAVIDASGTWNQPNPLGASGIPALGETAFASHITFGMPDILGSERTRYAGKRVLVVGAGHSAAGNLIALASLAESAPGTQILWAIRGDNFTRIFGGGEADSLPARGELGQKLRQLQESGRLQVYPGFRIHELRREHERITVLAVPGSTDRARIDGRIDGIDEIIAATGSRPNLDMTRELRLKLDHWLESTEALAPLIDPNEHSCGTVRPHGHRELAHPELGYYSVGARSYGRAPTFLMATGYEQVRSVVAALAGDPAAADDVQLDLPQTGVCSVSFGDEKPGTAVDSTCCEAAPDKASTKAVTVKAEPCCGGPAVSDSTACCVADEQEKVRGGSGCGCGTTVVLPMKPRAKASCG